MTLLAVTADTWIVTGLGFGIVLVLLICLVFILQFFGWVMQKATAPKAPKEEKREEKQSPITKNGVNRALAAENHQSPISDSIESDAAAVAYALYLATQDVQHDAPTAMISLKQRETVWNTKSIGLN